MKKLSFLVAALAMVSMVFTSCKKDEPAANQLYDGFYLVGEATAVADFNSSDIAKAYMGAGFNEVTKEKRAGMYEKYVALEANKPFKFILHESGKTDVVYGGDLKLQAATSEGGLPEIDVYWGQLQENVEMQVPVSGLYHVVLDLNLDGQLTATGGKQIMLVPVAWGIRGGFIDKDWSKTRPATSASDFSKTHMVFNFKDVTVPKAGQFKFVQADCWKIYLDMMGQVKCETSLGIENGEITTFGNEINFDIERGIYDIELTWDLVGGACGKSFKYKPTKTADVPVIDYSNCEMELVGAAVADQAGAVPDEIWSWGNRMPIGKPVKNGDVYTWTANAHMIPGGFKIRTLLNEAQGDIAAFDNGSDLTIASEDDYEISLIIDAAADEMKVDIKGGTPLPDVLVTVKFKLPADWTNTPTAWVWPTGGDGVAAALAQDGDWWVYTTPAAVPGLNIIVRNGDDWTGDNNQTVNIENLRANVCYQIQEGTGKRDVVSIDCE